MELRQLRYLLTIANEGSFTRAANSLYVSQSALSQQIKLLESELGVRLFDRAGRRVLLTPAGEALLRHTRQIFQSINDALVEIGELESLQRGEVKISAVETVIAYVIPEAVSQFTRLYPAVRLIIQEKSDEVIEQELLEGEIDVGIGFVPPANQGIAAEPLYEEKLSLIVTKRHPFAQRERVAVADLHAVPLILLPKTYCTRRHWDECAAQVGIQPQVLVEMNTVHGILHAVAQTGTATILPAITPSSDMNDDIVGIPLINPTPRRSIGLLYRQHGYRSRAAQAFVDILKKISRQLPDRT